MITVVNNLGREAENDSQERERERGKGNRGKNQWLEVHEPRRTRHFDPRTSKVSKCLNPVRKVSKLIADIDDLDVSQQEWTQSLSLSLSMGVGMGMGMGMGLSMGVSMGMGMRATRKRWNVMMHAMGRNTLRVGTWVGLSLRHRSRDVLRSRASVLRSRAGSLKHRLSL